MGWLQMAVFGHVLKKQMNSLLNFLSEKNKLFFGTWNGQSPEISGFQT